MAYQHPGLRNNALPSVQHLKTAIRSADDPDPRRRDIRPLIAICTALPQADPDILGFMQTRRLNLLSWPWRVVPPVLPGTTGADALEAQRAADIESRIRDCGITSEFDAIFNAIYFGHTGIELGWSTAVDGAHRIERYELIDAVDLHPDPASVVGYSRVTYARYDDDKPIYLPYAARENILLATYNPMKGGKALYYGGLLRSVIWHTMLKHGTLYDWARFNEKYGDPPVYARYPVGAQKPDIDKVFEFLTRLAQDSAAAIPEDVKIEIIDAIKGGANIEAFDRFIDRISSKQERILLGQDVVNKTTEVGSNAKSQEANKTTANYNFADIELFQTWLTDQVVAADYRLNYGLPARGQYPRFRVITDEGEDFEQNARIIERLSGAGFDLDPEEVSRMTGFTVTPKPAAPALEDFA
jgi:phage gp29-like protein